MEATRQFWGWIVLAALVFFLDAPFRTFGQNYVVQRNRERWILLSLEADVWLLWGIAKYLFHLDLALVPASAQSALAVAGLALTLAGAGLAVWGKLRLGRWFCATFAIKEGHPLITDGPYRITRHPIYSGAIAACVGTALVWNSLLTLGAALVFGVPLFLHTVYEEVLFEHHFGAAYREYERRVPRLIPLPRPRRMDLHSPDAGS